MRHRLLAHLGWPLLIGLTIVPVIMWAGMAPLQERFGSAYLALGSIGKLAGIAALVLFCVNVILTTRLKMIESLFGGLNKMYIVHHLSGGLALCIILVHPIAFSLQRAIFSTHDAALFLLPRPSDIPVALGITALWIFIGLMVVTFFASLPYRIWLFTHKFLGLVLLLIGLHIIFIVGDISANPALKTYLLCLVSLAAVAFIYRTLLPRFFVRRHTYTVTEVTQPAENVIRIFMEPRGRPMSFTSGQFIFVSFRAKGISHEWHPFSVSSNSHDKRLAITVKSLGKYTEHLVRLAPDMIRSEVGIEGAYGKFSFRNFKAKRQIWIAGGIGITPFLGMIKDITPDYQVDLYYSVKTESEMIDADEIRQLATASKGNFRFIPHVADRKGLLTSEAVRNMSGDLDDAEVLLCGPPPMMRALREQFKKMGVSNWRIHSEEFSIT